MLEASGCCLVEDSIVRATTLQVLLQRIRQLAGPREIHVRVACPPIISPCFYGIDMSTDQRVVRPAVPEGRRLTPEIEADMAADLGADSLHYLPVEAIARAIGLSDSQLCRACITGDYPTPHGRRLYQIALSQSQSGEDQVRTYSASQR